MSNKKTQFEGRPHDPIDIKEDIDKKSESLIGKVGKIARSRTAILLTTAGLALNSGNPSITKAETPRNHNKNDPANRNMHQQLREGMSGATEHSEKLSEIEIQLMDTTCSGISRQFLQESFDAAIPSKHLKKVKTDLLKLIAHADKLAYKKEGNQIIITRRNSGLLFQDTSIPNDFKVVVHYLNGKIINVNGVKINHRYMYHSKKEWRMMQKKIMQLSKKIISRASKIDRDWYAYYMFKLPRKIHSILSARETAFGNHRSQEEKSLLQKLNQLLPDHPKNHTERTGGKPPTFMTRFIRPGKGSFSTPDLMVQLANPKYAKNKPYATFAGVNYQGKVMKKSNGKWSPASRSYKKLYKLKKEIR